MNELINRSRLAGLLRGRRGGMTMEQAAKRLSMTQKRVSQIEHEKGQLLAEEVLRICDWAGTDVAFVINST